MTTAQRTPAAYFTYRRSAATTTAVTVVSSARAEVERIYTTLRAAEYGTTVPAHDLGDDK